MVAVQMGRYAAEHHSSPFVAPDGAHLCRQQNGDLPVAAMHGPMFQPQAMLPFLQDFESISRIGDSKKREQAGKTGRWAKHRLRVVLRR